MGHLQLWLLALAGLAAIVAQEGKEGTAGGGQEPAQGGHSRTEDAKGVRVPEGSQRCLRGAAGAAGAAPAQLHRVPALLLRPQPPPQPLLVRHQSPGQRDPALQAQTRGIPVLRGGQVRHLPCPREPPGLGARLCQLGIRHRHRRILVQREALAEEGAAEGLHGGGHGLHPVGRGAVAGEDARGFPVPAPPARAAGLEEPQLRGEGRRGGETPAAGGAGGLGTYTCTATSSRGRAVATYTLQINDLRSSVLVFPQESQTSHVQVTPGLELPLNNFTVCLRSFSDLTRPYSLFSYATKTQSNDILLFKPKPGQYELVVGNKPLFFTVPTGLGESEHVCFSWESSTGIVGFWFNGKPWPRKGLQKGYTVGVPAHIVLGQDQDSFGGGFDTKQSFVGEISSVYMWDTGISNSGVVSAMYDSPEQTPVFGWRNFPYKIVGEVYLKP